MEILRAGPGRSGSVRDVAELACKEASLLSAFALTNALGTDCVKDPHAELLCLLELAPDGRRPELLALVTALTPEEVLEELRMLEGLGHVSLEEEDPGQDLPEP